MTQLKVTKTVIYLSVPRKITKVYQVAPFGIPSGISESIITAAGELVVGLGVGQATVLGAPAGSNLVVTSDLTLAEKMKWAAPAGTGDIQLTNQSGVQQDPGTVAIWDGDHDSSFNVTTVVGDRRVAGIVDDTIDLGGTGSVAVMGRIVTVKVAGNVNRGEWLIASATSGRAKTSGSVARVPGTLGLALTSYAGGGNGTVSMLVDVDHYLGASKGHGIFAGGNAYIVNAQILNYSTEVTTATAGANLSLARAALAGVSGPTAGYFGGGNTGAVSLVTDKCVFATDITAAQASANLSAARYGLRGVSGSLAGYFGGGYIAAVSAITDKLVWATEVTAAQASANLSAARYYLAGASGSLAGYFGGGNTGAASLVTDKCVFATDVTAAQASANLSVARSQLAGTHSSLAGYFGGGNTGAVSLVTDKLVFATDITAASVGANLSVARASLAGVSGSLAGYFGGGTGPSAVMDKTTYASDTTVALAAANLPIAALDLAGIYTVNY